MCRNITELRGLEPPATSDEVEAAAQQYIRKVSGILHPSAATEASFEEAVATFAQAKGVSRAQVALAWLLSKPNLTAPIIGTTKLSHLEDAVGAVDITLTADEIAMLEAPYRPHPILGHA